VGISIDLLISFLGYNGGMANHRMFSHRIANSARFLQMPLESQLLYFHMILRADDDGVVESYPLIKLLGTTPDSFKMLLVRGLIKSLNEDQVVVIPDWLEHNKIRPDRKINSLYNEIIKEKYPEINLIEAKPRSDVIDNSKRLGGGQSTVGLSQVKLSEVKNRGISQSEIPLTLKQLEKNEDRKPFPDEYVDDSGNEIRDSLGRPLGGAKPKLRKPGFARNTEAIKICNNYQIDVQGLLKNKSNYALNKASYSKVVALLKDRKPEEIQKIIKEYIDSPKFNHFPQLTAALSDDTIRRYDNGTLHLTYDR